MLPSGHGYLLSIRLRFGLAAFLVALALAVLMPLQALASQPASRPSGIPPHPGGTPLGHRIFPTGGHTGPAGAAPSNDNFAKATAITKLPFKKTVDISGATTQSNEPNYCDEAVHTVWYKFKPTKDTLMGVDTVGSNFDTVLTLFRGTKLSTLTGVSCDEFSSGAGFVFTAKKGQTYYFQAGGCCGDPNESGTLHIRFVKLTKPANDLPGHAVSIKSIPYMSPALDIRGGSNKSEPSGDCGSLNSTSTADTTSQRRPTVWYKYTAASNATLRADMLLSKFYGVIGVYSGSSFTHVACAEGQAVAFAATKGKTYYFQVGADYGAGGTLRFRLQKVTPPTNDAFAHAEAITSLPFHASPSTLNATFQPGEPTPSCTYWGGQSVWFSYTTQAAKPVRFDAGNSALSALVAAYTGSSLEGLTEVACGQAMTFAAQAGTTYWVQLFGDGGQAGAADVRATTGAPPANDNIASAIAATNGFTDTIDQSQDNYATTQPGEAISTCLLDDGSLISGTVWYSYTANADGVVRADTLGSDFDTTIGVYSGSPGDLAEVTCNNNVRHYDGDDNRTSSVTFPVTNGTTYFIQIGGEQGQTGTLQFALDLVTPPPNDAFANAAPIAINDHIAGLDTSTATHQNGEPDDCGYHVNLNGHTVWYKFHAPSDQTVIVDASNSNFETEINVYTGSSLGGLASVSCGGSSVDWTPASGTDYYVQVTGYDGSSGTLDMTLAKE